MPCTGPRKCALCKGCGTGQGPGCTRKDQEVRGAGHSGRHGSVGDEFQEAVTDWAEAKALLLSVRWGPWRALSQGVLLATVSRIAQNRDSWKLRAMLGGYRDGPDTKSWWRAVA